MRLISSQVLEPVQLQDVLSSFSAQTIATQRNLDAAYLTASCAFRDLYAWALEVGLGEIVRQFEPQHLLLQEQQLQFEIATGTGTLEEVRIVNQVFAQRYRARTTTHSITIRILRSDPQVSA
jgi:hypothetical protein